MLKLGDLWAGVKLVTLYIVLTSQGEANFA